MGYDTRNKKASAAENTPKDVSMKVEIVDEGILEEEVPEASDGKQEQVLSELENIIMEGDIILNVHADAEAEEPEREWQIERRHGVGEYCRKHHDLFHLRDEKLVQPGDMFATHKEFIEYISANAKRWCFYYKCTESYNVDTDNESYVYNCVYLKNKDYKRKSIKKNSRYNSKTDCPCKIKLKRRPYEKLTVVYVCNHHDHELSEENFNKLVNNRKLPPYIKEVIMDLLSLEVEIPKIMKYVEVETGIKMNRAFLYDIERKMKIYNEERQITAQRLKELSEKIAVIDDLYNFEEDGDMSDDQGSLFKKRPKAPKAYQAKKKKKTENMIEVSIQNLKETTESSSSLKERITYEQDGDWIIEQTEEGKSRNNSANWDISSIPNNDQSQLRADTDDDTQEYTEQEQDETYQHETLDNTAYSQDTTEVEQTNTEQPETGNQFEYQTVVLQDEFGNVINCGNDEQIVIIQDENGMAHTADGERIGYFDGEKIIYMDGANIEQNQASNEANDSSACDVAVQTNSNKPGHSETQVSKLSDMVDETVEIPATNGTQEILTGDIYTKHEYIHRYNIDHYMTKPNFPKYIETLAKKTRVDVLHMLTKVYNEKAMFKMTTTQRGKEGNTKIWYLTDVRRKGQYKMSDEEKRKRDKIGQYLTDILILKETVKSLKKENGELISRNKYLEEVALRLANMRNN